MKTGILAVVVLLALAHTGTAKTHSKRISGRADAAVRMSRFDRAHHPHDRPSQGGRVLELVAAALMLVAVARLFKASREMLDECAGSAMSPAVG